jgi:hypothetical protein
MPYIVTTKRPCDQPACDRLEPCEAECSGWCAHPDSDDGLGNRAPVSRRAVATPEDVRDHLTWLLLRDEYVSPPVFKAARVQIGPLPDGTVIEVEPCDRFWLLAHLGRSEHSNDSTAEIIAAFNAAQETGR